MNILRKRKKKRKQSDLKVNDVPFLQFLLEEGFTTTSTDLPEGGKPWIVYLTSEKFNIRISQDRGGVWLSLAPPIRKTKNVSDLKFVEIRGYVSYFLDDITYPPSDPEIKNTVQQIWMLTDLLEKYYDRICAFFEKKDYSHRRKELEKFSKARREYDIQQYKEKIRNQRLSR